MYQILADNTLIYDSTIDDYKINKASINLEVNKSGSFTFSVYPDHFYYERFIKLKTVITVYKSGRIIFRGRILNDTTDYWNNKTITCEGELGFFQDSIIRPFTFSGSSEELLRTLVEAHNNQVDDFKKFNVGKVTAIDDYIGRSNEAYESTLSNFNSRLLESELGGYLYITHGDDGTEETPTLNYLSNFETVSSQKIEFGENLKDYTKTAKGEEIATAIIPLGASTNDVRLNITSVNDGVDYVYDADAVALRGWIFKVVEWDDVTVASNLKAKAEEYLESIVNQAITIELNAIDLHLLDHSIESFKVGDYISISSEPHNFNDTMLCSKQTIDLLKPENDSVTLGYTYSSFTEINSKATNTINRISTMQSTVNTVNNKTIILNENVENIDKTTQELSEAVLSNSNDIALNKTNIAINSENIGINSKAISDINLSIEDILTRLSALEEVE